MTLFVDRRCLLKALIMTYIMFYYIDIGVLLENTPLVKVIRNYIWDSGGVFSPYPH